MAGPSPRRPSVLRAASVPLAPALGLAAGTWIVLTSPYRDLPGWPVWAGMATVLGTAAGAVFVYGLERWAELRGLQVIQDAERQRLEQLLGVDRGVFAELQSGLVILGPLLASAAAAFLPG